MRRIFTPLAVAISFAAITAGGIVISQGGTPPPASGLANIWLDTTGGTCTDEAPHVYRNDGTECNSWDAANDTCEGGDVVLIRNGSYGNEPLTGSNGRSGGTSVCTFSPDPGQTSVQVGDLMQCRNNSSGCANSVSFTGPVLATGDNAFDNTNFVSWDGWEWDFGGAAIIQPIHGENAHNVTIKNSSIHSATNANAMIQFIGTGPFLIDNNDLYESFDTTSGTLHTEGVRTDSVSNMTFTRNHLWSMATMSFFIAGSGNATNWVMCNNIFEHALGPNLNSLAFRNPQPDDGSSPNPDGFLLCNNTFAVGAGVQFGPSNNPTTSNAMTITGNFFPAQPPCGIPNTNVDRNAFITGQGCGTNSFTASTATYLAGFVNPRDATGDSDSVGGPPGNYHLLTGSVLKNTMTAAYPAVDRDNVARPQGANGDMGAYEFVGG